jgi:adenylyltransferase/sulfurtransferase
MRITSQNVMELLAGYDILVDGTDNFETRYLLNDAAVLRGIPVVYGAIYQFEGQAAVWNVKNDGGASPNYRDLFPTVNAWQIPNCADGGVIPTLAGIIGCIQANEVIKYITKTGDLLAGKMLVFDAQTLQSRIIKIREQTQVHIRKLVETMTIQELSAEDLKAELANNTIKLIDVRTPQEREELSLGGEHIPISEILSHVDDIAKNSKIVFYCATGKRSAEAAKIIKSKYPDANVFTLAGGTRLMDRDF